jgi:hypothetical protein
MNDNLSFAPISSPQISAEWQVELRRACLKHPFDYVWLESHYGISEVKTGRQWFAVMRSVGAGKAVIVVQRISAKRATDGANKALPSRDVVKTTKREARKSNGAVGMPVASTLFTLIPKVRASQKPKLRSNDECLRMGGSSEDKP